MGRKAAKKKPAEVRAEEQVPKIWLKAELEFPSTFSYRQPDASAQFAIGSPIPSPAAIKLALVDTAIRWSGSVEKGKEVFEWLKNCQAHPVPPEQVVRFRVFLKRLKPEDVVACPNHPDFTVSAKVKKEKRLSCPFCGVVPSVKARRLTESTGIRDYFLLDGALTIFLQVPQDKVEETRGLFRRVRRLGTSDSLCWCCDVCEVSENDLPKNLLPRKLDSLDDSLMRQTLAQGFIVVRLSDLTAKSEFDGFNPFGGAARKAHLDKASYLLPLRMERYGETWAVLKRSEFPCE